MNIIKLSYELIEIILSFLTNKEIKQFLSTCKEYDTLIDESTRIGWINDAKISNCDNCTKYKLHPQVISLQIAGFPKEYQKYYLCSEKCKCKLFHKFPRCYFCLNIIGYKKFDNTLYCSVECVEKSLQNISRERYIS